ncbi:MAG: hypothetical protein A3H98_01745 [Bacteroidetes bacterium RIFCSPLOWO2_02_FULL_36_8]|nr:MAG: hypothetical protein A3H98_01745 [Bacteroidetes bacterium RIFCSPLOWO2_02_FULL_36_8]OFY69378.1 MAG: hypothetical protein A3G23_01080 [Bacteroidetes bacterium RIFCSPLOWO2_12_FULL_37_12]
MEWIDKIKENWIYITFAIGIIGAIIYYIWQYLTGKRFKKIEFTSKLLSEKVTKELNNFDSFINDYRTLKKSLESLLNKSSFEYQKDDLISQKNQLEKSCSHILLFFAEDDYKESKIDSIASSKFIHDSKNKIVKLLNNILLTGNIFTEDIRNQHLLELNDINEQENKIREQLGKIKSNIISKYSDKI